MSTYERITNETSVVASFSSGSDKCEINTNYPFLNHMLDAFSCHGNFFLKLKATGDIEVDPHHLVEDTGYALGKLIKKTFDYEAIVRANSFLFPMDDALARVAIDLSGRSFCHWQVEPEQRIIGNIDIGVFREFFSGFARGSKGCIHISLLYGSDPHHAIEAVFKAFGRALSCAVIKSATTRSTKGVIDD